MEIILLEHFGLNDYFVRHSFLMSYDKMAIETESPVKILNLSLET